MRTCPECGSSDISKDGLWTFMCGTCGEEWEIEPADWAAEQELKQ